MTHAPPLRQAVVLGGAGFLGRHLIDECRRCGLAVSSLDRRDAPDVAVLRGSVRRLLEEGPDLVVHAAGLVGTASPSALEEAHVRSTTDLLEDVASLAPTARVVVVGSAAEAGPPPPGGARVPEAEGGSPAGAYGRSKLAQSSVARDMGRRLGVDVVRVRVFNTLGPGQDARLVGGALVDRLRRTVRSGGDRLVVSDPESVRDFLDARDVARCLLDVARLLPRDPGRPPVNVCSEEGTSVAALAGELLAASGARAILSWEPSPQPPSRVVGACPTLRGLLGGAPVRRIDTLTSLRDMWATASAGAPVR